MHGAAAERDFAEALVLMADPETRQKRFVWFALTSFLSNAAMMSKYLDPGGPLDQIKKDRRTALRDALGVNKDSDVLPCTARDNVEHFDERIDKWVGQGANSIIELVLDTREDFEYLSYGKKSKPRLYHQGRGVFV